MFPSVRIVLVGISLAWIGSNLPAGRTAEEAKPGKPTRAVVYPAPGQRDIPRILTSRLTPDPLPESVEKVGGYPVTVDFVGAKEVTDASIVVRPQVGDRALPIWASSPGDPANKDYAGFQKTTVCAIPKDPLEPDTRYTVTAKAVVDGVKWSKTWTFVTEPGEEGAAARECKLLLKCINEHRRQLGLGELVLDPRVSRACHEHACYLGYNQYGEPPINAFVQDRKLLSTPNGKRIAPFCVPVWSDSDHRSACACMLATPSGRDPLLDPRLRSVGIGCDPLRPTNKAFVLYGVPTPRITQTTPVVFPAQNATGVPLRTYSNGCYAQLGIVSADDLGYPASTLFPVGSKVEGIKGGMFWKDDTEVSCWNKDYPRTYSDGQVGRVHVLIPKRPLRPNTTYKLYLDAVIDGRPWEHESQFTTGSAPALPDPKVMHSRVLRSLNLYRRIAGLEPVTVSPALSAGCAKHAEYLKASTDPGIRHSLAMHDQDPKGAKFSPEGQLAARSSVVLFTYRPIDYWIDEWLQCLYHRGHLLNPDLRSIGIGYAPERNTDTGWICVVDVLRGIRR